jgi:hypothetical protein
MKALLVPLLLLALSAPALAATCSACGVRPAPGPIMGAGLIPVLVIGGGIYWIVRRKKTPAS